MAEVIDMNTRVLPAKTRYSAGVLPLGVQGQSSKRVISPQNAGPYNSVNNTIRFVISSQDLLDTSMTCLKFQTTVALADNAHHVRPETSINSIFKKLTIYSKSGGQILEQIDNYGLLHNLLSDMTMSQESRTGFESVLQGFGVTQNDGTVASNTGEVDFTGAASVTKTFMVPVMSGIIGGLMNRYLPIQLTGDLIADLEICNNYLVSSNAGTVKNIVVSNPQLHVQLVSIKGDFNEKLKQVCLSSSLFLSTTSYRCYTKQISTLSDSFVINERIKSCRSLLWRYYPAVGADSTSRDGAPVNHQLSSLQVRAGSSNFFPAQPCTDQVEYLYETLKALGVHNNTQYVNGNINAASWARNTAGSINAKGSATYGMDMDVYGPNSGVEAGTNLAIENPLYINITSTDADNAVVNCYVWLHYDMILKIGNDGSTTVSY